MDSKESLGELKHCKLCDWKCGVNRLDGELGTCRMALPVVASCQLHPAPPQSYTIFTAGCNFRCLNCQNYQIAHYPEQKGFPAGFMEPKMLAIEAVAMINSPTGKMMGADRIFFSGGEPTIHLPYIEEIVKEAREIEISVKVNYDTNGFLTEQSLKRVLKFTTSITYDIKAYNDEVHRALTGAPVEPVLRNAEYIAKLARTQLWEFRILVVPEIVDKEEIGDICQFIASLDPQLPVCFLAFRPNFILDKHYGASLELLEEAVEIAKKAGIENAYWTGRINIRGHDTCKIKENKKALQSIYKLEGARNAGSFALYHGCKTQPRNCGKCESMHNCSIKGYKPIRRM